VVITIVAILIGLLLPALGAVRESARQAICASNLRQLGITLNTYEADFSSYPVRPDPLDSRHPHTLQRKNEGDVTRIMLEYMGEKEVGYCPSNPFRTAETLWPEDPAREWVTLSYQFPFWVNESGWFVEKPVWPVTGPDSAMRVGLDIVFSDAGSTEPTVRSDFRGNSNHPIGSENVPIGVNTLYGDGHAAWVAWEGDFVHYAGQWGMRPGLPWFWFE